VKKLLRGVAKRIPGVPYLFQKYVALTLKSRPAEDVFTSYFARNTWGGRESVSGQGSDAEQTRIIVRELGGLVRELGIRTLLDVPCGDFHWMNDVDLGATSYVGADIVADLIKRNEMRYGSERVRFEKRNLVEDSLPKVDMIFCRDCLVHFSYEDVFRALRNICDSGSTYLLTTSFPGRRRNEDIVTGQWRPLNLQVAPIALPAPMRIVDEGCTESNGAFRDKALCLWYVDDLRVHLRSADQVRCAR
jgi:hypothetical protein